MSYRRLSLLIFGQLAILCPVIFLAIRLLQGNTEYAIALMFFSIIFVYTSGFVVKEIRKVRNDKLEGIKSSVLIFCNYNLLYKSHRDNMSPVSIATFRFCDKDEYISLSGDYSGIKLVEGKWYNVRYYKNNGILIDIYHCNKKKKVMYKVLSKKTFSQSETLSGAYKMPSFLNVLVLLPIYGIPTFIVFFGIYQLFIFFQGTFILSKSDILFIRPDYLVWIFVVFGFITLMLTLQEHDEPLYFGAFSKLYKRIGYRGALTIISILFFSVLYFQFNTYTKISADGIEVHNFYDNKTYSISNIKQVKAYPVYNRYKYHSELKLIYSISMDDGKIIDLNDSDMFWDRIRILNRLLNTKGITIDKTHISYTDAISLISDEEIDRDTGMEVLEEILDVDMIHDYRSDVFLNNFH